MLLPRPEDRYEPCGERESQDTDSCRSYRARRACAGAVLGLAPGEGWGRAVEPLPPQATRWPGQKGRSEALPRGDWLRDATTVHGEHWLRGGEAVVECRTPAVVLDCPSLFFTSA